MKNRFPNFRRSRSMRHGTGGRAGAPLPETEHSNEHRAHADDKRARRAERRLTVDQHGYR